MQELFFELLRVSLGTQDGLARTSNDKEWAELFEMSIKQSLTCVMLEGVNRLKSLDANLDVNANPNPNVNLNPNLNLNGNSDLNIDLNLLLEWIGTGLQTENQNKIQNDRAKELYEIFKKGGYRSCVLKGQGTATYYDRPEVRQSGDIDLWVEGDRDEIVRFAKKKGVKVESVDVKDSAMEFFDDVVVEVHYRPNCMFNPFVDKKLQAFFQEQADKQFSAYDEKLGFAHTTIEFDLVYSLVHIYRHIFSEGIGLRQLVDYYYILQSSTEEQRQEAYEVL